jgi:carbon monoxide dehydrogenase subunit G
MWFEMRREGLSFVEHAPVLRATVAEIAAPRADVFRSLADAPGWARWFPNVRTASYTTPAPYGRGTIRVANVARTRWEEEIIVWDDGRRFGWTVVGASVPLATAQVELFELTDAPAGTAVRWTLALEPRLVARIGARFAEPAIRRLWQRASKNLEQILQRQPETPETPG